METDLQTVVKIENDLVERQLVNEHYAVRRYVFKLFLHAAFLIEQRQDAAEKCVVRENRRLDKRLFDLRDAAGVRHLRRRIDLGNLAVGRRHAVTHARGGGDQVEIEFALKPFLDDLHVQQAEEAAAETETERGRRFRLKKERSVVQPQLFHRVAKVFVLRRVDRVKSGENHRLHFLKSGKRLCRRAARHR